MVMEKSEKAPIVLFVYRRENNVEKLLEELSNDNLSGASDLFVFSDTSDISEHMDSINRVRRIVEDPRWESCFRKVTVIKASEHKGLAKSVISGVTEVINKYGKVIVLEDDLEIGDNFLSYMNDSLDYYENSEKVWSISGHTPNMKSLKRYKHDVWFGYRGDSWGWATWKDRWDTIDWDVSSYDKFITDKKWQDKFNLGGKDLTHNLSMYMNGEIDSWAIRWCFEQSNQGKLTVYPRTSYIITRGYDGEGTHNTSSEDVKISGELSLHSTDIVFIEPQLDAKINREFYPLHSDTIDKKIRRNWNTLFVEHKIPNCMRLYKK